MKRPVQLMILSLAISVPAMAGQRALITQNPLDEMRDEVKRRLAAAGSPFTAEQESAIALVIEEQKQATEDLYGRIFDFRNGPPQGQDRDRAVAGIRWMSEEFRKKLRTVLTAEQNAAVDKAGDLVPESVLNVLAPGSRAPDKDQIQQIRINNNPFTTENGFGGGGFGGGGFGGGGGGGGGGFGGGGFGGGGFGGGGFGGGRGGGNERTEVIQRGGTGEYHGSFGGQVQDESLNARNPFAANKPPYQERQLNASFSGPVIRDRLTLNLFANQNEQENVDTVNALTLDGPFTLGIVRPNVNRNFNARGVFQLADAHAIHFGIRHGMNSRKNQGVGGFSLPERASNSKGNNLGFDLRQISVLSERTVYETRFARRRERDETKPVSGAVGLNVLDAFRSGSSQDKFDRTGINYDFGNLLYYT